LDDQLRILCEVQSIDMKTAESEKKKAVIPQRIAEMDREIEETKERLVQAKELIDELEKERKKKEKELDVEKEQVKKSEAKLYDVKTNKEYQALLKEIEAIRGANDRTEEDIILLLERIEEMKKDYDTSSAALKKREKEAEKEKKDLHKEMESVDDVVTELKKGRQRLVAGINKSLLERYDMVYRNRGGIAVVSVKNGVCKGCFMNIPPQLFIEVMKNTEVITCPSCNRILYYEDEEEEA
jgi:predicted  nucleic acid-binding Zn-ribbon protein